MSSAWQHSRLPPHNLSRSAINFLGPELHCLGRHLDGRAVGGRVRDFHCSVGEREVRELPGLVPGVLELGEYRGGTARI